MTTTLPLDWSIHEEPKTWPRSRGRVFLAEAVRQLGYVASTDWEGEEPYWAHRPPHPYFPSTSMAFDENGPVAGVYDRYVDLVRSILSPAAFQAEMFQKEVDAALESAEFLTLTFEADELEAALLRAREAADLGDRVTPEHWEYVWEQAQLRLDQYEVARERLGDVSTKLISAGQNGELTTFMRPIVGGAVEVLQPEAWEIRSALPRMATCGINYDEPMNPDAAITHHIFVSETDLYRVVRGRAPKLDSFAAPRPQSLSERERLEEAAVLWILQKAEDPESYWWAKKEYEAHLTSEPEFEAIKPPSLRKAWTEAAAQNPVLSRKGRRPEPRPSGQDT